MVWQANLAKLAAALTCAVVGIVAFASLAITKEPTGPDGGEISSLSTITVWIIRVAFGLLLLLLVGLFYEREALEASEKLPKLPRGGWKRNLPFVAPFLLVLVVPVVHLTFSLTVVALGLWFIVTRVHSARGRMRCVALFDGLVLVGMSLVLMRAGPSDDYRIAQVLVGLHACAGGLLPGLAIASSLAYAPALARLTRATFGFAGFHAACVVLQAVGNYAYQVLDGTQVIYTKEQCFPPMDSLFGLVMKSSAEAMSADSVTKLGGDVNELPACPAQGFTGIPCDPIKWYCVLLAFLGGLWLAAAAAAKTLWQQPVRVAPGQEEASRSKKLRRRSIAKSVAAVWLFLAAVGILIPSWWVFWLCPDEGHGHAIVSTTDDFAYFSPDDDNTSSSTTTTSSTSTTTSSTSTSTITTTATTTTSTTANSTLGDESNSTDDENDTAVLPVAAACDERLPPIPEEYAPSPPRLGCRCGEPVQAPIWAWTQVPAEQLASTWCDLGNAAPVLTFSFLLCLHLYVWSLAGEQLVKYEIKERELAFKQKQRRLRDKALRKGVSVDDLKKAEKAKTTIVLWQESKREPMPKPVAEIGQDRLFTC